MKVSDVNMQTERKLMASTCLEIDIEIQGIGDAAFLVAVWGIDAKVIAVNSRSPKSTPLTNTRTILL